MIIALGFGFLGFCAGFMVAVTMCNYAGHNRRCGRCRGTAP